MKTRSGLAYHVGRLVRRASPYATAFAAGVAQRALSNARNRIADRIVRPKAILPGVISTQHDVAGRYRRKRMPRRKRKKWIGFSRKVSHSIMQLQPLLSYTYDIIGPRKQFSANTQVTDGQMLGVVEATNNNEILQMFRAAYGALLTRSTLDKYRLFVKSLCLDVQITNTGLGSIIIDVYTVIARQNSSLTGRIDVQYTDAFAEQSLLPGGGTVDPANPSTTPFQNPLFCSLWKILSKKEILLGAGQTTTMQLRIPYNRYLSGKYMENVNILKNFTRAFLFQGRGTPEYPGTGGVGQLRAGEFTWMAQITCAFGLPPTAAVSASTRQD